MLTVLLVTYIKLTISIDEKCRDLLVAELSDMEFDAFEEQQGTLITYVPKERFNDICRKKIGKLLAALPGDGFIQSEEAVADRNWNEEWERTISAQQIGRFVVKPTWDGTVVPGDKLLLEIDPKMAFGTGYHETTRLILEMLPETVKEGDRVLDVGTGTGILAMAAVKLGAEAALALDIDEWSVRNAKENVLVNGVEREVSIRNGSVEQIPDDDSFGLIIANIDSKVIKGLLPGITGRLNKGGTLLLSGLLFSDRDLILNDDSLKNYILGDVKRENDWIALRLTRKND